MFKSIKFFSVLAFVVIVIEIAMRIFEPSPAAFARPAEVIEVLPNFLLIDGSFGDVWKTLARALLALVIAIPIGLVVGVASAKITCVRGEAEFLVDFLRSIPATALVPLFLVIFGIGDASKVAVGSISGALAIAISVIVGLRGLNVDREQVANTLQIRGISRVYLYELPEIAPAIFVGLRTAASLCLILVVVSEMFIGSEEGIGRVIMDRRYSDDVPSVYAAIFIAGLIGYAINRVLLSVEKAVKSRIGNS